MESVRIVETKTSKAATGRPKKDATTTIRVSENTKRHIETLLSKANKKSFGKRVKADAIISQALSKLCDEDIQVVQSKTISGKDRFEALYREHGCRKRGIDRDEFLDQILSGKIKTSVND